MVPRLCLVLWLSGLPALGSPFISLEYPETDTAINTLQHELHTAVAPITAPMSTPPPHSPVLAPSDTFSMASPLPTPPTRALPLRKRNNTTTGPAKQCTKIPANPDVSGIGIRLWFYFSAILSIAFPTVTSFTGAFAINSFILALTAIVATGKKSLSRYHAVIVRTYLTCAGQILMVSPTPPVQRGRVLRLLLQDNAFYPFLFFKTLWLVFNHSGYDGGGPNPECNHLFQRPPLVFMSKTLSDRNSRIISILLELTFVAITVVIKNLPQNRQELFRQMRSSWIGTVLSIISNIIPAITTIERWIRRHSHIIDGDENDLALFGQIMTVMTLISVGKDSYGHFQKHGWPQWFRKNAGKREKVD